MPSRLAQGQRDVSLLSRCHAIYLSTVIFARSEDMRSSAAPAKKTTDLSQLVLLSELLKQQTRPKSYRQNLWTILIGGIIVGMPNTECKIFVCSVTELLMLLHMPKLARQDWPSFWCAITVH